MAPLRELPDAARAPFERWLEAAVARVIPPLTFAEVRKGVRALSARYVERRAAAGGTLDGRGKRAAFTTYYAALHFLTAWEAAAGMEAEAIARVHDLGCGSGAAGAATALAVGAPAVRGVDRAGWVLPEARRTYAAFGLSGSARRGSLPGACPTRAGRGDLLLLGWSANELDAPGRAALLERLVGARERGARLLVLEPLSGRISPWWDAWSERLAALDAADRELKSSWRLPEWVAQMDRAAGLDHRVLGARAFVA